MNLKIGQATGTENHMRKLLLSMLFLSCCSNMNKMALEFHDVQFFKIRETKIDPTITLEISGLAFHSSLAVSKTEVITQDNTETVFVYLTPAKKGLTGL